VRRGALALVGAAALCGLVIAVWTGLYGTVSSVESRSWVLHARDEFRVMSSDGRARAAAAVEWHHGAFPSGFRHRGVFTSDSVVEAIRPVGCLWARVEWGFPLGTVISSSGGYTVKCKGRGERRPVAISLARMGYAKGLLHSVMLTLCVSARKAEGPRFCGAQKVTYSLV
jgi:hypothetical protein